MLILFVEYHSAFRQAASYLLDQEDDLEVVSQASSVAEGREKMAQGGIDTAIVNYRCPMRARRRRSGSCMRRTPPSLY